MAVGENTVSSLLEPFQRFGVNLGLSRIKKLLTILGNPQDQVPIIHVAGTNGKGSVCAYLSSILKEGGYRVGRYTSPHLVDWTERICLNGQAIAEPALIEIINDIKAAIKSHGADFDDSPTQFEVITAAAWLYFARSQVDIAVMEVGLGGRLDATNVKDKSLVSVITSLSREHWQRLGPTLADIAREKAGVIKQNCPVIVGQLPPEAHEVVAEKASNLNATITWIEPASPIQISTNDAVSWAKYQDVKYPLPLLGAAQLSNSAIAIAVVKILQQQGWKIPELAIQTGMNKTRWLGRLQWTTWNGQPLLIDGAHNPAAALILRQYADTLNQPVVWVMGMLSTKDHTDVLEILLKPNDELHLVPVPDRSSAATEDLAAIAQRVCPYLQECCTYKSVFDALAQVTDAANNQVENKAAPQDTKVPAERTIILCGSLYLIGHLLQNSSLAR